MCVCVCVCVCETEREKGERGRRVSQGVRVGWFGTDLMVPVGEGMGETKGEVRVVSILRGCWMGEMGGGREGASPL